METKKKKELLAVAAILALSFARMYFIGSPKIASLGRGDETLYSQLAVNLIRGHGFSQSLVPPYRPNMMRTPGYPLFLAAVYRVFGAENYEAARLCQILLMLGAGLALWGGMALLVGDRRAALLSLILFSLYSFDDGGKGVYGDLITETLTIFLVNCGFLLAALCLKRPRRAYFVGCGVVSALAALTRPSNLYYPVFLAALFAWRSIKPRDIILFCAASALLIAPWFWRNHRVFSRWAFCYPILGMQLMQGLSDDPDATFYSDIDPTKPSPGRTRGAFKLTAAELAYVQPRMAEVERDFGLGGDGGLEMDQPDSELRKMGFEIMRRDPAAAMKRVFYRALGLWSLADLANILNGMMAAVAARTILKIAAKLALAALALFGALAVLDLGALALIVSYPVYNTAVVALVGMTHIRYGLPARAFLFALLAVGTVHALGFLLGYRRENLP